MTPKQLKFCQVVASGSSFSTAYRRAYNARHMNPNSVHNEASKLMKLKPVKDKVESLVGESDKEIINEKIAKKEDVLVTLTSLMETGLPSDSPKIRAAELLGRHHGIFAEKNVVKPPEKSSTELAEEINRLLENTETPRLPLGENRDGYEK